MQFQVHKIPFSAMQFQGTQKNHSLCHQARQRPEALLISKQTILFRTHGDTCCPGVLTPKNQSLADSSKNHPQTMKVATFPTVS
jgi:hypothetical protein